VYLLLSIDIDIDFAAHAELREVNARFHGEASARQHTPLFACFQIFHVGPVAVSLLTDGVSGSMAEVLSIAGLFNDRTSSLINFPALKGFSATKRFLDAGDGRVAGLGDDLKDLFVLGRHRFANEGGPRQVTEDGTWPIELGPKIDE